MVISLETPGGAIFLTLSSVDVGEWLCCHDVTVVDLVLCAIKGVAVIHLLMTLI